MSYELNVNAGVQNLQSLQALTAATDKQDERTRRLSESIQAHIAGNAKLSEMQAKLALQEVQLEQLREKHRIQLERLAAESDKATASQERLNNAHRRGVTEVQAASGALRELEGNIPIRAAEQFITKMLGFGPALQAIFPIVGAIAFFDIIEKGADKLGIHLNIWKQITEAQKESNEQLKRSSSEYDSLIKQLQRLQEDEFRRSHGNVAGFGRDSFESAQQAGAQDRQRIQQLEAEIAAIRKITTPTLTPSQQLLNPQEAFFAGLGGAKGIEAGVYPSDVQQKAAKAVLPGLEGALRAARVQQEVDDARARDFGAKQDQAIDTKNKEAQHAAEQAQREAERRENSLYELGKRSREAYSRSFFGDESNPERKYSISMARIAEERDDALRKLGTTPESRQQIKGDFLVQGLAAVNTRDQERAEASRKLTEEIEKGIPIARKLVEEQDKELKRFAHEGIDLGFRAQAPTPPAGYVSPQEQLRQARDTGRRNLALFGAQSRLAGLGEGEQAQGAYNLRIQTADAEYHAALKVASVKNDEAAKADALAKREQEYFDARLQHEQQLLEIALRQKEQFQSFAVGLVNAAQGGGIGGFLKGQLHGLEDKIVSNIAGEVFQSVSRVIPHAGAGTALGKILQGTPFGPDPTKVSIDGNTSATAANTAATLALTRAMALSRTGGGGGLPSGDFGGEFGGIPGLGGGDGGSGDYGGEFGDPVSVSLGNGGASALSKGLSKGLSYAGAGIAAYTGIRSLAKGGAKNVIGGIGALAGGAALLDPEPISKAILAGVSLASGVVSAIFGNGPQNRANQISKTLETHQFMSPVSINASMGTNGGYADFDRFGGVRGSSLSPYPSVEQGYFLYREGATVPGRTVSQFGGGATVIVQVQTMDSKSFLDNSAMITEAVNHGLQTGRGTGLQETLRNM